MSDQASTQAVPTVADPRIPIIVGEVTQYCSGKQVAVVDVIEGGNVVIGDEAQFGTTAQPCTRRHPVIKVRVTSIQQSGTTVPEAVGPGSFGIKTGRRGMRIGTPVFVLRSSDPVEG